MRAVVQLHFLHCFKYRFGGSIKQLNDPLISLTFLLRSLYAHDHELLVHLFPVMRRVDLSHPTDVLFLEVLPVPPPRARPVQFTGGLLTQHPQSVALQNVVEAVTMIKPLAQVVQGKDIKGMRQETQDMIK